MPRTRFLSSPDSDSEGDGVPNQYLIAWQQVGLRNKEHLSFLFFVFSDIVGKTIFSCLFSHHHWVSTRNMKILETTLAICMQQLKQIRSVNRQLKKNETSRAKTKTQPTGIQLFHLQKKGKDLRFLLFCSSSRLDSLEPDVQDRSHPALLDRVLDLGGWSF